MNRKGQYLTIEQMFLFGIGLAIAIAIFYAFGEVNKSVEEITEEDLLSEAGSLAVSGIVKAFVSAEEGRDVNITAIIPKRIFNKNYIVEVRDNRELVAELADGSASRTFGLEGINNTYTITGRVFSAGGTLRIEAEQATKTIKLVR